MATNKFACMLKKNPRLLTQNSYLNFLRCHRAQHPRYGLRRILETGYRIWTSLLPAQRKKFKQKHILGRECVRPRLVWRSKYQRSSKVPRRQRVPRSYRKRTLSAKQNIRRRRQNLKYTRRYKRRKFPGKFYKKPYSL